MMSIIIGASQLRSGFHSFTREARAGNNKQHQRFFGVLGFLNLHVFWQVWVLVFQLKGKLDDPRAITHVMEFDSAKFNESMFEALPQILLQLYVLLNSVKNRDWTLNSIAIASITTSLVSVSLGLCRRFPSRLNALDIFCQVMLFFSTFFGTTARIVFWVFLALRLHVYVFGVALGMWLCHLLICLFLGPRLESNQVVPEPDKSPNSQGGDTTSKDPQHSANTSNRQGDQFYPLLRHAGLEILHVSPFTMTKLLGLVNKTSERIIMGTQLLAQVIVAISLISDTSDSFGLVFEAQKAFGWLLLVIAFVGFGLGLYQLQLFERVKKITEMEFDKSREDDWGQVTLPGELDVEFVRSEGDETFLMAAARHGFSRMVQELLLRQADPLKKANKDGLTALGKSTCSNCSTSIVTNMLANNSPSYLSEGNFLFPEINKSIVQTAEQKIEILVLVLKSLDPAFSSEHPRLSAVLTEVLTARKCTAAQLSDLLQSSAIVTELLKSSNKPIPKQTKNRNKKEEAELQHEDPKPSLTVYNSSKDRFFIIPEKVKVLATALKTPHCRLAILSIHSLCPTQPSISVLSEFFSLMSDCIIQSPEHLFEALKSCCLTSLSLIDNDIGSDGAYRIAEALQSQRCRLTHLTLDSNPIDNDGVSHLEKALQSSNCKLQHLSLAKTRISNKGISNFTQHLGKSKLSSLSFKGCAFGKTGAEQLSAALKSCSLEHLNLSDASLIDSYMSLLLEGIRCLECKLKTLDLSDNDEIKNEEVIKQVIAVAKEKNIRITLPGGQKLGANEEIGNHEAGQMDGAGEEVMEDSSGPQDTSPISKDQGKKLSEMSFLIDENTKAVKNLTAMVAKLEERSQLSMSSFLSDQSFEQEIRNSPIGSPQQAHKYHARPILDERGKGHGIEKARQIADSLKMPDFPFTMLHFSGNKIGDDGAEEIAGALQSENCKLASLKIDDNGIGPAGARAIAEALGSPKCKLQYLNMSNNKIGHEGAQAIIHALSSGHCNIRGLTLSWDEFGDDLAQQLTESAFTPKIFWKRSPTV